MYELTSITIEEAKKENKLGIVSTVTAVVTAVVALTSSIVGAVKAKRMREAMEKKLDVINEVRNYAIKVIQAYNEKVYSIRDSGYTSLSGGEVLKEVEGKYGIVNDGYSEFTEVFPSGLIGATSAYNSWHTNFLEKLIEKYGDKKTAVFSKEYQIEVQSRRKVLKDRFNRYGFEVLFQNSTGYSYFVPKRFLKDYGSKFDANTESWFGVFSNGKLYPNMNVKGHSVKKRQEIVEWRDNMYNKYGSAIMRADWLESSGLPSWVWYAFHTGKDSYLVGTEKAKNDFQNIVDEVNRINKLISAEKTKQIEEEKEKVQEMTGVKPISTSASFSSGSVQFKTKNIVSAKERSNSIVRSAFDFWESLTKNQKLALGSVTGLGLFMAVKEN